MPAIPSTGNGSGLNVPELVDKLVSAEGAPVKARLDRKEAKVQEGLTAMDSFKGAVSGLQDSLGSLARPDTFAHMGIDVADEDALTATATPQARPGRYEVEIVQLAQAQRLASDPVESDVAPLGTGTLTIQLGHVDPDSGQFHIHTGQIPKTVTIKAADSSLSGIAEAINRAGAGVRASVVNDGSGYRLLVSSKLPGKDGSVRLLVDDDDGDSTDRQGLSFLRHDPAAAGGVDANGQPLPADDGHLQELVAAQDALLRIDGLTIRRSGNTIDDAIEGVSLELQPGSEGKQVALQVAPDTDQVIGSVRDFVAKYNELMQMVNQLTGYDPDTRTAGPLSGDAAVRGIAQQLRNLIGQDFSDVNDTWTSLASIGITTQRDGTLSLDEARLAQAIEDDLPEVSRLFAEAGEASDPLVDYQGHDKATRPGRYALTIERLPTAGELTGAPVSGPLELTRDTSFRIAVDGVQSGTLTLPAGRFASLSALANALRSAIQSDAVLGNAKVAAKVAVEGDRLVIQSKKLGSGSKIEIVSIDPLLSDLTGLSVGAGQEGQDVAGRFNGAPGKGHGRILVGTGEAQGLEVAIQGGSTGPRGVVNFSNGIAAQMEKLITGYLDPDGLFDARREGYDARMHDIQQQREQLARRLSQAEERYTRKFSALDATLRQMRSTSKRLSKELEGLPGARKSK